MASDFVIFTLDPNLLLDTRRQFLSDAGVNKQRNVALINSLIQGQFCTPINQKER